MQTTFPTGSKVKLTDAAKLLPFWRCDNFKNGTGTVCGPYGQRGQLTVKMHHPGGGYKTFYIEPGQLVAA